MIRAKGLTKDYGRHRAVDDVSFTIRRGDIVGLLGPNGSGKTTIMRMLTGFFAPTSGSCTVAGFDTRADPRQARRHIGYLPERVALYPNMTVRAYLRFVARVHEVRTDTNGAVDESMDRCGLTQMADRHIGKLSRGYRQRVGIAQAVIHRPEVLILDEPTVGLDPRQIVEIRELIRRLAGNTTVLLSTHILPEVSITCRRVLILDHGRLVAEDTAEALATKTYGSGETLMRIRAPMQDVIKILGRCPGVADVRVVDREASGMISVVVTSEGADDPKPALARAVIDKGWALHEVGPHQVSLEDLFVQILEQAEQAAAAGGKEEGPA
jgi:ABC-2 type transport system ATP-binding protein